MIRVPVGNRNLDSHRENLCVIPATPNAMADPAFVGALRHPLVLAGTQPTVRTQQVNGVMGLATAVIPHLLNNAMMIVAGSNPPLKIGALPAVTKERVETLGPQQGTFVGITKRLLPARNILLGSRKSRLVRFVRVTTR